MFVHELFRKEAPPKGSVLYGIELEMEGNILPKVIPGPEWRVEHDGSLRGEDNAEYVLRKPLSYEDSLKAFSKLVYYIDLVGEDPDPSRRTSTHVHVDCRGLHMEQLISFIVLFLTFEEFLVDWCGEERKGNLFSLQTKDAEGFYVALSSFLTTGTPQYLSDNIRYSSINLAALGKYGSVEFRSLRGTLDKKVLGTWLSVLDRLRNLAEVYKNPLEVVYEMSVLGPDGFAAKVLGPHLKAFFKGRGKAQKLVGGIRRAQDIAFLYEREDVKGFFNKVVEKPVKKGAKVVMLEPDPFWMEDDPQQPIPIRVDDLDVRQREAMLNGFVGVRAEVEDGF